MKIGIVLYPTFGGSGVVATELGKALVKKGHEIHFISYRMPVRLDQFHPCIHYHEVRPFHYPLFDYQPYELALTSKLVDVSQSEKLDVLHVHYAIPHASAAYFAQRILKTHGIEIPFVTTLHGTDITLVGRDPSFEPVITFTINHSNAVTAVSQSLREATYRHFKVEKEIDVIYNFIHRPIDFPEPTTEDRQKRRKIAPDGVPIISHISNFRKVKRVEDVVRVFKQVSDQLPAKLVMAGDGPERYKVEQQCKELGVCSDVHLVGSVQSASEIHRISDVFVLPSETESFGLAALEALACGVPVISSNTGGLPEVNVDGVSGFLSDVGDVDKMTKDILFLLEKGERLRHFKRQAYAQSEKFSPERILPQYEAVYHRVLEEMK